MRVLLAGGGTAGHITPALATAEALRELRPDWDIAFVGTPDRMEARLVPAAGWPLHTVPTRALRGRSPAQALAAGWAVLRATRRVARLIRQHDVRVAGIFGGYVSGPLALAARLTSTPLVVHEQNAVPGLANRLASRWAQVVAVTVPGTAARFAHPERVVVTGNPVRGDLLRGDRAARRTAGLEAFDLDPARRTLLVFGGSLGARRLNDAVLGSAGRWPHPQALQVLHATGTGDHERVAAAWDDVDRGPLRVRCVPYLERMDLAYAVADLVVCRAGASTLAELTALGLPSVLVPYPHAAADEQSANARALADAGAAAILDDAVLDATALVAACAPLLADDARRAGMAAAAAALGRAGAARGVAELLVEAAASRRARARQTGAS